MTIANMIKTRILLVENEVDLGNVIKQYLEVVDFEVVWRTDGRKAFETFKANPALYDILLIDVNLPGMDGFELANNVVKTGSNASFLFLTARSEKSDRLHGLKIGADDYITKPFDIEELVLRIKNIVKRKQPGVETDLRPLSILEVGNAIFDVDQMKLIIGNNKEFFLTERESELLQYLLKNSNRIIKREEILTQLWGANDYFFGRSLDVFISRLRKYLAGVQHISITNIYGVGFILNTKV
jgi:two-component system response regulator TrcR